MAARLLGLAMWVMAGTIWIINTSSSSRSGWVGVMGRSYCPEEFHNVFENTCGKFIGKSGPLVEPSSQCCEGINKVELKCLCKAITPQIEERISPKKVVFVADSCFRPLPPGTKCGSYTIPQEAV